MRFRGEPSKEVKVYLMTGLAGGSKNVRDPFIKRKFRASS